MKKKYLATCGLDCSLCPAFMATKNNDNQLKEKTAKDWTKRYETGSRNRPAIKAKEINCYGCLSKGPIYLYCYQCQIRRCGLKKGLKSCQDCKKYKCPELIELQSHLF